MSIKCLCDQSVGYTCESCEFEKLEDSIKNLQTENAKLFEDAKRELAYKDKKIAYLEAECKRIYHPIRKFWNIEKDEEIKRLKREIEVLRQYGNKDCTAMADEVLDNE